MPIERMPVPGLNALASQPNVLGELGAVRGIMPEEELPEDALEPVVMQQGGLVGEAATLQNAGRGGDSMLVHMNPEEVGALNQLGNSGIGGLRRARMTINPQTGLPEMFDFTSLLPMIAGIAATAMGAGPLVAAAAAAGGSVGGDVIADRPVDLGRAFMAGVGTYATAGLAADVGAAGAPMTGAESSALSTIGATGGPGALNPSTALLAQADAPAQLAAAQAAENAAATGMLRPEVSGVLEQGVTVYDPALMESMPGYGPIDPGAGGYSDVIASSEFPAFYADQTPISPEVLDLARNDPKAFDAAVRSPAGTTSYGPQDVKRNIGRHTWQDDAGGNIQRGMEKISPEWEASTAGEIGLGEIAQPALIGAAGTAGSMPPPVWEPPPPRRSYAYDVSGMPDRSYEVENPPEGYVPGEDPEWRYIKDTTPSYDSASGYGLGSLGPAEPYTFLSKHGYRGRGDLPTVYAAEGGQKTFPYGKFEALVDHGTPWGGFGPPKPAMEWNKQNLPDWWRKIEDPFNVVPKIEKIYSKAPMYVTGGLSKSYKRSGDPEYGLKDQGEVAPEAMPMGQPLTPEEFEEEEEEMMRSGQNLPTLNAALGSSSGTAYPQSGAQSRQVPAGMMGGRLSSQIPWDKLTGLSENGRETPAHPLTREEEEERLRRISNYYLPPDWEPMQRDQYAYPQTTYGRLAQASPENLKVVNTQEGTEGETVGEFVDPMPMVPIAVEDRYVPGTYTQPPEGYIPGFDPQHNYFPNRPISLPSSEASEGGSADAYESLMNQLNQGGVGGRVGSAMMGTPEFRKKFNIAYELNAQAGTEGLVVEEAALQQLPTEEAVTTGIMDVAPPAAQDALAERMAVTPSPDQPQNPEERAIFDQALLALQGVLEPDAAEEAIDIFIETFGMDAYSELIALVENKMDEGGIVKPANGETTVAMGEVQGPDMIPGNIVDPMTGEKTANLNVGENEYIEPAPSLARRAMAAGMPPTPENGAKVRGMEEDQLKAMYG